ncbi:hypothetical protein HDU88_008268 [Geranomyces variabilis]|nr:hypothetical protein HDU88_008268 [Geranomyces variabilis]
MAPARVSKKPVVDNAPKAIKQIDFGVFSTQDAKKLSVLELFQRDLYDVTQPHRPSVKFGVLDDRLGVADKVKKCETCGEGLQDCIGHFGVVRLAVPVFHIGYFKLMVQVLQMTCKTCSHVLLEESVRRSYLRRLRSPNLDGVQRKEILKSIITTCKKTGKCQTCGATNGTVKKVGALKVIHEKFRRKAKTDEEAEFRQTFETAVKMDPGMGSFVSRAQEDLTPLAVLRLFEQITNEDCELMGLDPVCGRPELYLWTALPVPPVCIRPSIGQENSSTEDDLTVLLSEIIEINTKIKSLIESGQKTESLVEYWDYLQLQCAMYVTSDLPGIPTHLQGNLPKIKKGFCQRLKGKHGRFRGNLSGKRVDFSARTVISPDPNLRIDQVAVPERACKILTYPERVTSHNIDRLRNNILNGTEKWPGATYLTKARGDKKYLRFGDRRRVADDLRIGDTVDRHLQDGDIVLFNRQPSLHKLSILSHYVKVRPWRTFRFNECVCTPYNADFDGDEMNLHVPQCFPVDETRVLTNHGFLFYDQLSALLRAGETVMYACYDVASDTLVFRAGKVVEPFVNPWGTLVDFTHKHEARTWDGGSNEYGSDANGRDAGLSNHLSLRVTPNHRMWAQAGNLPLTKFRADQLASVPHAHLRFVACAHGGVGDLDEARVVEVLTEQFELQGNDQVAAFLELFGFWLGDGSLSTESKYVMFCQKKEQDIAWLRQRLPAAGLAASEWSEYRTADGSHSFCVRRHSWYTALHATFSNKYTALGRYAKKRRIDDAGGAPVSRSNIARHIPLTDPPSESATAAASASQKENETSELPVKSAKWFPAWVQLCSKGQLRQIVHGLHRAEGKWATQQGQICTSSTRFRDELLAVLLRAGYSAYFSLSNRAGTICGYAQSSSCHTLSPAAWAVLEPEQQGEWFPIKASIDAWLVNYTEPTGKAATLDMQRKHARTVPHSGRVWCVTVEHEDHLIVAQRAFRVGNRVTKASKPIIVGQSEEARAEAIQLMGVKNNLVTPRNGEPLIAATQDFITASYLLSRKDIFYDRTQFTHICSYMSDALIAIDLPPPTILKPIKLWTGKQIFSVLLRHNQNSENYVNLTTKCRTFGKDAKDRYGVQFQDKKTLAGHSMDNTFCPNDGYLLILNSELLAGVIDKAIIGDGNKNSMFYIVMRDHGAPNAAESMNRIAKLSARWLANQGFSIGIDDVQPGPALRKEKELTVSRGYADCDDTIMQSAAGKLPNQPGCDQEQTLEAKLSGILSKIRDHVGDSCFRELNKYNAPLIMSLCGSKGSRTNVSQMVACVGQQIISGSRIPNGFIDRSLPHFPRNSKIPAAKGFVSNSFYTGLSPSEFFFHAVSGREGLVDTAVKTAETGYMQRRLMKALEDLVAHYDLSVRDSTGGLVQFKFGDDGLDPANIEDADRPVDFARNLRNAQARVGQAGPRLFPHEITTLTQSIVKSAKYTKACSDEYLNSLSTFMQTKVVDPLVQVRKDKELDPMTAPSRSYRLTERDEELAGLKMKVTKPQLDMYFRTCYQKYIRAMTEPGTAVGAIGAQSIGEPGTQMTLKTFHFAGVASMSITLGVPRIKEIINASKNIATPIITSRLVERAGSYACAPGATEEQKRQAHIGAEAAARVVKARIEKTTLGDVTEYLQEVIGPHECALRVQLDREAIKKLQLEVDSGTIRWSIAVSKLKILQENVRIEGADCIRIVLDSKASHGAGAHQALQQLKRQLPKVIIKGLPTVSRAVISEVEDEKRLELLVEGVGMREVMGTEGIDGPRTKCNHTLECLKTLGIEAARGTIISEILYTMKNHGMTIDRRHVMLLADLMSFKGEILGITRFGIAKMKDSVLMLASFEKTTDHLFEASFYGKRDTINGVSECIIMGVPMGIGTGLFKLLRKVDDAAAVGSAAVAGAGRVNGIAGKRRDLLFESAL